jgi:hypothetical protein
MANELDSRPTLPYAAPRPHAPRPALFAEVGCGSSLLGAVLLGVTLPWAAVRGFAYDGAPSVVDWVLTVLFTAVIGGTVGALVIPAVVLSGYWIVWRIAGRP